MSGPPSRQSSRNRVANPHTARPCKAYVVDPLWAKRLLGVARAAAHTSATDHGPAGLPCAVCGWTRYAHGVRIEADDDIRRRSAKERARARAKQREQDG